MCAGATDDFSLGRRADSLPRQDRSGADASADLSHPSQILRFKRGDGTPAPENRKGVPAPCLTPNTPDASPKLNRVSNEEEV